MKVVREGDMSATDILNRILNEAIKSNAEQIATIHLAGEVAVVVFEPGELVQAAMRSCGWDGKASVFALSPAGAKLLSTADHVTAAWLGGQRPGRILVAAHEGTLLINHDEDKGYSLEPGSTDVSTVN